MEEVEIYLRLNCTIQFSVKTSTNWVFLLALFQQTATSTNCNPCGRSAGTPTRAWSTTCASVRGVPWSPGVRRPWQRPYSLYWKRDCPCPKLPGSTTFHTRLLCCMPTASTTCSVLLPMVDPVSWYCWFLLYT